jgi:hypothetical protein
MTVTAPEKPSRRALRSTSTIVGPDPINAIDFAFVICSAGRTSNGASAQVLDDD